MAPLLLLQSRRDPTEIPLAHLERSTLRPQVLPMPLEVAPDAPTLFIRRAVFERSGLTRAQLDDRLNLTDDEFRVDHDLIAIGPLHGETTLIELTDELEALGLTYFDDFFEMSGNWPHWLRLLAVGSGPPGRLRMEAGLG